MKSSTLFSVVFAMVGLASAALADDYADIVSKGYRWVTVNGPYAYPTKEDARKSGPHAGNKSDSEQLDGRAYYLIPGMVVLVVESDTSTGLSRIRAGGITADLWTSTKFLSSRPIRDTLGVIETPDNASIISFSSPGPTATPSANSKGSGSPVPTVIPRR
jgi:hypothetical protein